MFKIKIQWGQEKDPDYIKTYEFDTKAELDALVCSAQEVKLVKKVFKGEIITPGIRFNSRRDDQKRVLSPYEAYKNGADWLVIGRDITKGNIKNNIQKLINHLDK